MLLLSALVFEPELFPTNTPPGQSRIERLSAKENLQDTSKVVSSPDKSESSPEPIIPLFGFKITQNIILKYSPLVLAMIYLMLATYLIYLDFLKKEYFKTYEDLYAQAEGEGESSLLYKIRLPNLHYILTDLSHQHSSKFVQLIFQTANVAKSLVLYVLPMVIVILLLGEGVQRATSNLLIAIFYMSPVLVILGTLVLKRDWFIETGLVFRDFLTIVRTKTLKKIGALRLAKTLPYLGAVSSLITLVIFSVGKFLNSTDYLSVEKAKAIVIERDFYDTLWNENGAGIKHQYKLKTINNEPIVIDSATNLTWQQAGTDHRVNYDEAETYIQKIRSNKFAGYDDWRLPTFEETISLKEPAKKNRDLLIDAIFAPQQKLIWTSDKQNASDVWRVDFYDGHYGSFISSLFANPLSIRNFEADKAYVRAVRGGQSWLIRLF